MNDNFSLNAISKSKLSLVRPVTEISNKHGISNNFNAVTAITTPSLTFDLGTVPSSTTVYRTITSSDFLKIFGSGLHIQVDGVVPGGFPPTATLSLQVAGVTNLSDAKSLIQTLLELQDNGLIISGSLYRGGSFDFDITFFGVTLGDVEIMPSESYFSTFIISREGSDNRSTIVSVGAFP